MTTAGGPAGCQVLLLRELISQEKKERGLKAALIPLALYAHVDAHWAMQMFINQLVVTCSDGFSEVFVSKASGWQGRMGPVVWDHLFHGETYDARREIDGWASWPSMLLAADEWYPTKVITPPTSAPGSAIGPLVPSVIPPVRATEKFEAQVG